MSRDRTRLWLLESIDAARRLHGFSLLAFVIMPEHVHIVVYPHQHYDIAWFLKSIKQPVSRKAHAWFTMHDTPWLERLTVTSKDGHKLFRFWQAGGGYDRNIDRGSTLLSMIEYIHNNPVRRDLVKNATDWPWSSASWYAGQECVLTVDSIP